MRIFATLLMSIVVMATHAHYYVVCVGVADYPGKLNDLVVSANDALTVQKIYSTNGVADVRCLTDDDATVERVKIVMRQTFSRAKADDAIIFFFSGHGVSGGFCCYDGSLFYKDVVNAMVGSKARTKIVLADACYAGKMRSSGKHDKKLGQDKDIMFFLSSRTTEKSMETGYSNSLFTIFLERGMRGGADTNRDRHVTARELYDFVHNGVTEKSKGRQHPVMWGNFDKNMDVIKW